MNVRSCSSLTPPGKVTPSGISTCESNQAKFAGVHPPRCKAVNLLEEAIRTPPVNEPSPKLEPAPEPTFDPWEGFRDILGRDELPDIDVPRLPQHLCQQTIALRARGPRQDRA